MGVLNRICWFLVVAALFIAGTTAGHAAAISHTAAAAISTADSANSQPSHTHDGTCPDCCLAHCSAPAAAAMASQADLVALGRYLRMPELLQNVKFDLDYLEPGPPKQNSSG